MKARKLLSLLLALCLAATLLAGCSNSTTNNPETSGNPSAATGTPDTSDNGEAVTLKSGYIDILNVGTAEVLGYPQWGSTSSFIGPFFYLIYDPVFYFDGGDYASDVLESWSFEDNGSTLVMKLREDVYFSNGAQATGEDLLYSFSSNLNPDRNSVYAESYYAHLDIDASSVGDDGFTVYLKSDSEATMVSQLGNLVMTPLMSKEWCEQVGWVSDEWYSNPVGSGPYAITEYKTDNYYLFTLREDWWQDGEAIMPAKQIKFTSYSEQSTVYMDLEGGAIDLAINVASGDYERALNDDQMGTQTLDGNVTQWLVFDIEDSPFTDENLRLAVAHAVKWDEVASAGKGVAWDEADSSIPEYFPAYLSVGQYEYDPDLAKQYLEKAGYSEGELDLYMVCTKQAVPSITVVQYYLDQIGINMTFDGLELSNVIKQRTEGTGDFDYYAMSGGSQARDAYAIYSALLSSARIKNLQTISDTTVDDLLAKAAASATTDEAIEYYQELQQWIYDTCRLVPIFDNVGTCAYNTNVISSAEIGNQQYPNLRNVEFVAQP